MLKAMVTGHKGFVGRHFVKYLSSLGWYCDGVDVADDDNPEDAIEVFRDEDCGYPYDLLVHCAYAVGGRAAIDGTNLNLAENAILDAEMFKYALRAKVKAVLYFSSSAAYPVWLQTQEYADAWVNRPKDLRMTEDCIDLEDLESPDADYGWAKLTGERLARSFTAMGGRVHVVRPFSGYGSDQSLDYPFPSIIQRATRGDLSVWGPPGQTRDWIHIDDVVRGAYAVYRDDDTRPVNLCTGVPTEMGALAQTVYHSAFGDVSEVEYLTDRPTGVFYRVGDPARMLEHYTPKISLSEGIHRAIQR